MATISENEFLIRIDRLKNLIGDAQGMMESSNHEVLARFSAKLNQYISGIEKVKPGARTLVEDDPLKFSELATPLLFEAHDVLIDIETRMNYVNERTNQPEVNEIRAESQHIEAASGSPMLPRHLSIKIPIFNGAYEEYSEFIQAFNIATNFQGCTKPHKFMVLKEHLGPRPKLLTKGLEPTDKCFDDVMAQLEKDYNQVPRIVEALQEKLLKLPPAEDNATSLRDTYENIEGLLRGLEYHKQDINSNELIKKIVLAKYPERVRFNISPTEIITLPIIRARVKVMIKSLEDVESIVSSGLYVGPVAGTSKTSQPVHEMAAFSTSIQTSNSSTNQQNKKNGSRNGQKKHFERKCVYCQASDHYSDQCRVYDTAQKRAEKLPEKSCFSCLRQGHRSRDCRKKRACFYCKKTSHNQSLCPDKFGALNFSKSNSTQQNNPKLVTGPANNGASTSNLQQTTEQQTQNTRTTCLAINEKGTHNTCRATVRNPATGEMISVRIFFDYGSDATYCSRTLVQALNLQSEYRKQIEVTVFCRKAPEKFIADTVKLQIISERNGCAFDVFADTVDTMPMVKAYSIEDFRRNYPQYDDREYVDEANHEPVSIVLGNDYVWNAMKNESTVQVSESLWLIETIFGWLVAGRTSRAQTDSNLSSYVAIQQSLEILWNLDTLGIREPDYTKEKEEELALQEFYKNITHDVDENRYMVTWPWKISPSKLPTNFALAKGCLFSILRKYDNEQRYLTAVDEIFEEQQKNGIIEVVENPVPTANTHYLPFHLVIDEEKTTPVRIVYNGSAKTRNGNYSLNDCLYKGVNLLPNMLHLLIRFRTELIVLLADVEKAFHQILLQEKERDYLRFLWGKKDSNGEFVMNTFRFRRVPFGVISSPFILAAVITFLLQQKPTPQMKAIERSIYVDNAIMAVKDIETAKTLFEDAVRTFRAANMNIRDWSSNSEEMLQKIPEEIRETRTVVSVLGLRWNRVKDDFTIRVPTKEFSEIRKTMRHVLSYSAKVYDPLGWFVPVTVRPKILLQSLHERKFKWNQVLNEEDEDKWREMYFDLQKIANIRIPRYIHASKSSQKKYQLHCFSDASKDAFAAVIYLQTVENEEVHVNLIIAKSRVAPLNKDGRILTIPRKELMGVVLAVRLLNTVRAALEIEIEETAMLWMDSKVVLNWLHTSTILTTFVRNRCDEIHSVPQVEFQFVRGKQNIADLATRPCTTEELRTNSIWWNGPEWLKKEESDWPEKWNKLTESEEDIEINEERVISVAALKETRSPFDISLEEFNSYSKLVRVTSTCVKFVELLYNRVNVNKPRESQKKCPFEKQNVLSYDYAKYLWCRFAQEKVFSSVFENLKQDKVKKLPLVKKLRLKIGDDGLIRCFGRFQNAIFLKLAKNPILLPKPSQDRFTFLFVLYIHSSLQHTGTSTTLMKVRENFFFTCGKREVYHVITKCPGCKRENAKPFTQPTESDLPFFRLDSQESPFTYVGIDICGPFKVLKTEKYILIATCLVMRGVSLEVVDCLETQHIYAALRRIEARRSQKVKIFVSDNMQQFLLLRNLVLSVSTHSVTWKLITQYSPWNGGAYERLIHVFKSSLYRTLHANPFCGPVQFATVVAEIECIMNDRPLTPVDAEVGIIVLKPNHFLRICYEPSDFDIRAPEPSTAAARRLVEIYAQVQETLQQFWNIWSTLYLQFLRERSASQQFQRKQFQQIPKIGDVVIVYDPLRKRSQWQIAKIIELIPSEDNVIRAARISVPAKINTPRPANELPLINTTIRSLKHLYFMELNEIDDQKINEHRSSCDLPENIAEDVQPNLDINVDHSSQESYVLDSVEVISDHEEDVEIESQSMSESQESFTLDSVEIISQSQESQW